MIDEILEAREKRYNATLELIDEYKLPVICGKINYPGDNKNTSEAQGAFDILEQLVLSSFNNDTVYKKSLSGTDGRAILMAINLNPLEAKKIAVDLEIHHPLGRIFDIDIYDLDGVSIGREKIHMEPRRCFLCNEDARVCMRKGNHSLEEVIDNINKLIQNYFKTS